MVKIGIDIGGVIIDRTKNNDNLFFSDRFLEATPVPDAIHAITVLNFLYENQIYLVSKASINGMERSKRWLQHYRFYDQTGIDPTHVFFCLERKDKASIAEKLKLTHFIDDRLEVLSYLTTVPNRYLFNYDHHSDKEIEKFSMYLNNITEVVNWTEAVTEIIR